MRSGSETPSRQRCGRASLPEHFTPHSLRHTYASLMLSKGAKLLWVSRQLGHADPSITLRVYGWALPDEDNVNVASLLDSVRPVANGGQTAASRSSPGFRKLF